MIRRKNYLIKTKFQAGFALRFAILLVVEAMLVAGLFMLASNDTITTGYLNSALRIERTPTFFFAQLFFIILIVVVGTVLAGFVVFTLLSHRIAGPLYRFETTLKELMKGDLTKRINLRKTDQLAELKESLNVLIESFDVRIVRIKGFVVEAQALLKVKDDPTVLPRLGKVIELLEREVNHFKATTRSKE